MYAHVWLEAGRLHQLPRAPARRSCARSPQPETRTPWCGPTRSLTSGRAWESGWGRTQSCSLKPWLWWLRQVLRWVKIRATAVLYVHGHACSDHAARCDTGDTRAPHTATPGLFVGVWERKGVCVCWGCWRGEPPAGTPLTPRLDTLTPLDTRLDAIGRQTADGRPQTLCMQAQLPGPPPCILLSSVAFLLPAHLAANSHTPGPTHLAAWNALRTVPPLPPTPHTHTHTHTPSRLLLPSTSQRRIAARLVTSAATDQGTYHLSPFRFHCSDV